MKIVIVSPYATVAPHFETELEIAQRHLDRGDQVTVISCLGELGGCDFNPTGNADRCQECRLRRNHGMAQLSGRVKQRNFSRPAQTVLPIVSHGGARAAALKLQTLGGFDIGYASLSSLISHIRDPDPDPRQHEEILNQFLAAAGGVYQQMLQILSRNRPDCVYVFNGRFASMRAVLRACQQQGILCRVHERGCDTKHFQIYENHMPHDIEYYHSRMRQAWASAADNDQRQTLAANWFHGRVQRVERSWHSFVKTQQPGLLPPSWDSARHNLGIFTSSDDEFAAIGANWEQQCYESQYDGIVRIANSLWQQDRRTHLTVRMHPNLATVENGAVQKLLELDLPNVSIIAPDAPIDSYHLMRLVDTVVTFGSSMGIEAVYWGRPSVLLGQSLYQNLVGLYRPRDHLETIALLATELSPIVRHEALVYGYWQQTQGVPFKYFQADGLFSGKFRGQIVYPKPPRTLGKFLSRQWQSVAKRIPGWSARNTKNAPPLSAAGSRQETSTDRRAA